MKELTQISIAAVLFFMSVSAGADNTCTDYTGLYDKTGSYRCGTQLDDNDQAVPTYCDDIVTVVQKSCDQINFYRRTVILNPTAQTMQRDDRVNLMTFPEALYIYRNDLSNKWTRLNAGSCFWERASLTDAGVLAEDFEGCSEYFQQARVSSISDTLTIDVRSGAAGTCSDTCPYPTNWSSWTSAAQWKRQNDYPASIWQIQNKTAIVDKAVLLKFDGEGWTVHRSAFLAYKCEGKEYVTYSKSNALPTKSNDWFLLNKSANTTLLNSLDRGQSYLCSIVADIPIEKLDNKGKTVAVHDSVVYKVDNCAPYKIPDNCCKIPSNESSYIICN